MSGIKIIIKELYKSFPRKGGEPVPVLDGITMDVRPHEFAVLLGPSGCGKTTLLRILAGLEKPDSGNVLMDDKQVIEPDRSRGMVFQSYTSYSWLTVLENVLFWLRLINIETKEQESIAKKYIKLVGLEGFEDYYPTQLSGGMKQRVAIARTLAVDPDILLLDEPFGALDSQTRSLMHELLLNIWERDHKTVLFVTHDIEEAVFLADDIYICSARPAKIKKELKVIFPRPRDFSLRTTSEFTDVKREVQSLIREESIKVFKEKQ